MAVSAASFQGGVWTLLGISLVLTILGAVLAFDLGGYASANLRNNTGFTPWGRRLSSSTRLSPYRVVGWIFLIPGAVLLLLAAAAGIAALIRA